MEDDGPTPTATEPDTTSASKLKARAEFERFAIPLLQQRTNGTMVPDSALKKIQI